MTSYDTRTTVWFYCKFNSVAPRAKGNLWPYLLCLIPGMCLVTRPTGSAFLPDDMEIMEVFGTVSEVGQFSGLFVFDDFLVVTFKA